jgi:hypothetical protein
MIPALEKEIEVSLNIIFIFENVSQNRKNNKTRINTKERRIVRYLSYFFMD